jgi:hypothetical protein
MSVTSGWDLGSEADKEARWGRTVPLGVAGVTRRGPVMSVTSGWDLGSEADKEARWGRTVPLGVAGVTCRGPVDGRDVRLGPWIRGR